MAYHINRLVSIKRVVIVKFEDDAAFKHWYNSPEYQAILPARLRSANDDIITVEN